VAEKEKRGSKEFCCLRPKGLKIEGPNAESGGGLLGEGIARKGSVEPCKLPIQGPGAA